TLNVALAAPVAAHVVVLGRNGNVTAQGPVSEVLQKDTQLHALVEKEQDGVEEDKYDENINGRDDTDVEEAKKVIGKLIVAEEKTVGRVEMAVIMLFVGGIGGPLIWALYLGIKSLYLGIKWAGMLVMIFQTWFVGYWASQYVNYLPTDTCIPALKLVAPLHHLLGLD
ncbi:hypothetical protein EW145_g8470, partial [Phellinidium pouzarii]